MTREEAVTVFKAFMENPLFSEVHKIAFNIAIHDIKAYQDWNINNLILVNKDNYEPLEQEPILDKIRTEINKEYRDESEHPYGQGLRRAIEIIDKYKAESEE